MRNLFKKFGVQGLVAAASLIAPVSVMAQTGITHQNLPDSGISNPGNFLDKVCYLAGWMFTIIVVFAVIAILIAAFRYVTANGDQEAVEGANKALLFAAGAVAIAVVAKAVPYVVSGLLVTGGNTPSGC